MDEVKKCTKCRDPMPVERKHTWCKECVAINARVQRAKKSLLGYQTNFEKLKREQTARFYAAAKITAAQAQDIRKMRDGGMTYKRIALYVPVAPDTIKKVCRGITWRLV